MTTETGRSCFVLQCIKPMYQLRQWAKPLWLKYTSYTSKALQQENAERLGLEHKLLGQNPFVAKATHTKHHHAT